ncbi:MAG: hypothetical protein ACJ76H_01690 [Bacteriovoracaceae bacterium]
MKFIAGLAFILVSVSCGKIENTNGTGIGELRDVTKLSTASGSDNVTFDQICAGLTNKEPKLTSSPPNLSFDVQSTDCDGKNVIFETEQVSVVNNPTTGPQFINRNSNFPFVFPQVETTSAGVFAGLCGKTSREFPVKVGNDYRWIRGGGDCPGVSGESCVTVETASKDVNTTYYRVHTREFIRFNITANTGKFGYFTYRRKLAESVCSFGKHTEDIVTLR